jgi:hypothetical protein
MKAVDLTLMTEQELARCDLFTYGPQSTGYDQIMLQLPSDERPMPHGLWIYTMHWGHGYVLVSDRFAHVYWYRFGCVHQWQELSQRECKRRGITHWGMYYYVGECVKCHALIAHDSSG